MIEAKPIADAATVAGQIAQVLDGSALCAVVHGEARRVMRRLPKACIDAVVTDPPYSSGGMYRGDRANSTRSKYLNSDAAHTIADFDGDTRDQRAFERWCERWMAEARLCTVPGGLLVSFIDWRQLPTLADAMQMAGWVWRGVGVWSKPGGGRPQPGRYSNACEFFPWATNGPRTPSDRFVQGHVQCSPVRGGDRRHQTEKPEAVLRHILDLVPPGGVVLDPFAGSGTTAAAAVSLGLRCICVESNETHAAAMRRRLSAVSAHVPIFLAPREMP